MKIFKSVRGWLNWRRANSKKVAVFIVNYNMPERADALVEYLKKHVNYPYDLYLVDNGSDLKPPARNTTVWIDKNIQTCRGWLRGLEVARESGIKYFSYWFLITSADFSGQTIDPLTPMVEFLMSNKRAVGIHPALTSDSTTAWKHLLTRGGDVPRQTWMIDNISSLFKANWFDSIDWFDPDLTYAWGIDLETCYLARKHKRSIWIDERVKIRKISNIAYKMNRMNMSSANREVLASKNMTDVLSKRYGKKYLERMMNDFVEDNWK